ncbi:phosphatidylinositol kinase, putative [Perkinsus marinus ATCC 50983]|uniref:Phosphatidylinositol kinase, putative n=1 Tax=Perkinsus marinus (strain ATCC 50983 / TXsc) TaxID=423536 RepID=C5LT20_PERM5|nr:phosphatidylinositol kinase, putative [Perkinsus marinus ATCC 50983]EEQ99987.1 phosphatidylinositol kinase, putative [Perkinsus marinus ATCC 50983]|eukprot:XP_002767270.1 phosphatidylinositol kinase, putative [Perkinsus marinus ATCC 50983]
MHGFGPAAGGNLNAFGDPPFCSTKGSPRVAAEEGEVVDGHLVGCFLLSEWSSSTPFHVCLSLEQSSSSIEENTGIALEVDYGQYGGTHNREEEDDDERFEEAFWMDQGGIPIGPFWWSCLAGGEGRGYVDSAGAIGALDDIVDEELLAGVPPRKFGEVLGGGLPNAVSLDSLKKAYGDTWVSLSAHFEDRWPGEEGEAALDKFCSSMAAYSVICYVLGVRDRHNANILLCDDGSICHVDFGFFLTNSPGNVAFEPSLKLTEELVETLGGEDSRRFGVFRRMVVRGCMVLRRDIDTLKSMIEGMRNGDQRNRRSSH